MLRVTYLSWAKNLERPASCVDFTGSAVRADEDAWAELVRRPPPIFDGPWGGTWGHPALIAAIASTYDVPREHVVVTTGGSLAMFLVCRGLLSPGYGALVEWPTYEPFRAAPEAVGATITLLRQREPDALRDALAGDPRIKAVILSNPHNPTGVLIPDVQIALMAEIAASHGAALVVDETFRDLVEPDAPASAALHPNIVTVNTLSKVYGMSRLRCGWIVASPPHFGRIRDAHVVIENAGSPLTQALAARVLAEARKHRAFARGVVRRNTAGLPDHYRPPPYSPICFPRIDMIDGAKAEGVLTVPGEFFGAPGHIRLGFGAFLDPVQITRGVRVIEDARTSLRE